MAKLIVTGMHEAIDLKVLRGEQILMLDQAASDAYGHKGDGLWLITLRDGVLQFCRSWLANKCNFYPLKPKKNLPMA